MKCFIIMFNRLTWPKKMAEFLSDTGCEVIFLDNNSTYLPLLEWYDSCPYKVYRLRRNWGHMVLWSSGIIREYKDPFYVVTDPDLDLSSVPHDYLNFLMKGFANQDVVKVGLSLRIDDLPVNDFTREIMDRELNFWSRLDANGFYEASVDTTFAIYDQDRLDKKVFDQYACLRSPKPYTARHLPWYLIPGNIPFEELHYMTQATEVSSFLKIFWNNFNK